MRTVTKTVTAKTKKSPVTQRLYSIKDAAQYMGRSVWGMRELAWGGKLPLLKDGKKIYFDVRDLDSYIERTKMTYV